MKKFDIDKVYNTYIGLNNKQRKGFCDQNYNASNFASR